MLDFTSALYLGLHHASASLRPWKQLTTGAPAALVAPPDADAVAQRLAALIGCECALLAPSTLHLFWDLFGVLTTSGTALYVDVGVYPIARWGVERAAARGVPVRGFRHHDPEALRERLRRDARLRPGRKWRPIVVADGFCPGCGEAAPVAAYLEIARAYGGLLVLDDTQALGILGRSPDASAPYGRGGGGVLQWSGVAGPDVLVGSSLAKGFGAPVAVIAGSDATIRSFKARSETRVHCSPPSAAVILAAESALDANDCHGDILRGRLATNVSRLRQRLTHIGFSAVGELFPFQTLALGEGISALKTHERLQQLNINAVLHRNRNARDVRLSFLLTARHRPSEIDSTVEALSRAATGLSLQQWRIRDERAVTSEHGTLRSLPRDLSALSDV
jgi:8-amino-7-oxononanoate synthase